MPDDNLTAWEARIIKAGIFLIFVVTFGDYVFHQVWPILRPLFHHVP